MKYLALPLLLLNSACGMLKSSGELEPTSYSFDGVKLIRPDIDDGSDSRTIQQNQYMISDSSRLLLTFDQFLSKVDEISLGGGKKVYVYITVDGSTDVNQAQTDLKLCPVTSTWMMWATWYKAYPFGSSGDWKMQGGDYHTSECVAADGHTDNTLQFDMTSWVVNYAMGRKLNYGLLLISSSSTFGILGDQDGAKSPRIEWMRL